MFRNLYTSFVWSSAYPTNIHVFPLSSNLDLIFLPSCMAITAISPNVLKLLVYLHLPHRTMYGWFCSFWPYHYVIQLCSVEMTSHQNSPLYFDSIPAWISMALALPINVGILLSATEFCWGLPDTVNSKVIPRLALSHSFCRLLFSPLLSSLILLILMLCFFDRLLIQINII